MVGLDYKLGGDGFQGIYFEKYSGYSVEHGFRRE